MRSHDTVSEFAYVSNFTYVSKCVHVNGALGNYIEKVNILKYLVGLYFIHIRLIGVSFVTYVSCLVIS